MTNHDKDDKIDFDEAVKALSNPGKKRTFKTPNGQIFCNCGTTIFVYNDTEIDYCPDCNKDIRSLPVDSI